MEDELVKQIEDLMAKHEVHNRVLAIALAILVVKAQREQVEADHQRVMEIIR